MVLIFIFVGIFALGVAYVLYDDLKNGASLIALLFSIICFAVPALVNEKTVEHVSVVTTRLQVSNVVIITDKPKVFSYTITDYSNCQYMWLITPNGGKISDIKVEDYDKNN